MLNEFKKTGMKVEAPFAHSKGPSMHQFFIRNADDPGQEIDRIFSQIASSADLFFVILPSESTDLYNAIKQAADIKFGRHTICVLASKLVKRQVQYMAHVALKFNLKFGGQNQSLDAAQLGFLSEGKTMLVGLDVTHPSPRSCKEAPSIAGIVASVDANLARWPAHVQINQGRAEIVANLNSMLVGRLQLWAAHNGGAFPENIVVYRDGVSDGQYLLVLEHELPQLRAVCKALYPADAEKPRITIIVCGKRHNTRFYPTKAADADQKGCTKNGTVVDCGVTQARIWEFYLQAHTALQGTPRPAHYVVIHDEVFRRRAMGMKAVDGYTTEQLAADTVERLTYALCHLYGRATKSVSLCTPAYYADLVCYRARRWLSDIYDGRSSDSAREVKAEDVTVHERLRDSMFYI